MLNKWLSRPGGRIVQGCAWSKKTIIVWVEFPEPHARDSGDVVGIDVGKLLAISAGRAIGEDGRHIPARVRRLRCIACDHTDADFVGA